MKPVVVIIGRPNVGKSTLFNRLTRSMDALVDDLPGVTRDRHYGNAQWNDVPFTIVDTGGFMTGDPDEIVTQVNFQIRQAVEDADAIIMVLDGKHGLSPYDREMMTLLRDCVCPVFPLVNKIDGEGSEPNSYEFHSLGIEKIYPVSATHGYGINTFLDELTAALPKVEPEPEEDDRIKVAVIGKPNVGKSTLINRILGEERLIVSDIPGTTRDSLDTLCERNGRSYLLIDTAGLRRKSRVEEKLEKFSALKTLRSIDRCDVALILIDAAEGVTQQDITVAGYAYENRCSCIFVLNKWDMARKEGKKIKSYFEDIRDQAKFLSFAPIVTISAKTGWHLDDLFTQINAVYDQYTCQITTGALNTIIKNAVERTQPSLHKGHRLKFNYATQISTRPPAFVCFVNFPDAVHFSYQRYLINALRKATGLDKIPLRLFFREKTGRIDYAAKKGKTPKRNTPKRAK
ncbi:MAG: ribosome biogenesis GTPase Der [Thermodesulfobacteriota bacterium]